jgi:hypothetical protein
VNEYRRTDHFMTVERFVPESGAWVAVRADFDWDTTCRWRQALSESDHTTRKDSQLPGWRIVPAPRILRPDPYQVTLTWQTDAETPAGVYRLVHDGRFKKDGKVLRFKATSRQFQVGS